MPLCICLTHHRLIFPAYDVVWPGLVSEAMPATMNRPQIALRMAATHCPALFHTHVVSAVTLFSRSCWTSHLTKDVYAATACHRRQANFLVKHEIENLAVVPSDELMLATLSLAAAARPIGTQDPSSMKFLSPLATAQSLHVYGTMNIESAYRKVLFFMLEQRGGLGHVQLCGLAEGIEL